MIYKSYFTLLAATLLLACQQNSDSRVEADLSAIENQLIEIEEIFLTSEVPIATQIQEYLDYYIDDLVLLPPGGDAVHGYAAALAYYTEGFDGYTILEVDYRTPDILLNGDMAVRRYFGTAKFEIDGESEPASSSNRYIDILQRQPDGEWLMVWHTWTHVDL